MTQMLNCIINSIVLIGLTATVMGAYMHNLHHRLSSGFDRTVYSEEYTGAQSEAQAPDVAINQLGLHTTDDHVIVDAPSTNANSKKRVERNRDWWGSIGEE